MPVRALAASPGGRSRRDDRAGVELEQPNKRINRMLAAALTSSFMGNEIG
jgi:hypothetical protein